MTPIGIMDTGVPLYVAVHIIYIPYSPVPHTGTVSHILILALHIYMCVYMCPYIYISPHKKNEAQKCDSY